MALLAAARDHWTEFRGRRTGDKTRRTGKELVNAIVSHVPADEKACAATRDATALDKRLKNLRTSYGVTLKQASGSGASSAQKEDAIIKFGGAVLFGMATAVFEKCPVSSERTVREPVDILNSDGGAGGGGGASAAEGGEVSAWAAAVDEVDGGKGADGAPAPAGARVPGNAGGVVEAEGAAGAGGGGGTAEGAAGAAGGGGTAEGAAVEVDTDADSSSSDGHEITPVASALTATAPSVVQTAAEIEAEAQAKLSKTSQKNKKETAASVMREYLKAKMANGSPRSSDHEAGSAAGTGGPGEASICELRLAVVNLLSAFAEKARGE